MSANADIVDGHRRKGIFNLSRSTAKSPSPDPEESRAPTDPTNLANSRSLFNKKSALHNAGVALEFLKIGAEASAVLAPLKAVCGGLKILVDIAEAIQRNDTDLRDLKDKLYRHLGIVGKHEKRLSACQSNITQEEVEDFVGTLSAYIADLKTVEKALGVLNDTEEGRVKGFLKKLVHVHSDGEDIKDCSRKLDNSFQFFMSSITGFIANQVTEMRKQADEKKANDALSQLPCSDARGNQHNSCLEGTRATLLKDIMDWAASSAVKPIFCLVDQAGTGKSTISIDVAQKLEKKGFTVARFFFSVPNSVTDGRNLATTLARDFTACSPTLRSLILEALNDHPNTIGRSIEEKLDWFVFTPLRRRRDDYARVLNEVRNDMQRTDYTKGPKNVHPEISERGDIKPLNKAYKDALAQTRKKAGDEVCMKALRHAYLAYTKKLEEGYRSALGTPPIVVIDALDECSEGRDIIFQSFLAFLAADPRTDSSRVWNHNWPLKLFLTCRPNDVIPSQSRDYKNLVNQTDFGSREANSSSHHDITKYANEHLSQILSAPKIDLFVARANGLFIWASTAKEFLKEADDLPARFKDLMSQNIEESPIYSLYDKILCSAVDRIGRDQAGRGRLKKVLQGVCVAQEPLSTTAMNELLGLEEGVADLVVKKRLSSVLSSEGAGKPVRALHPTFIEYLRSHRQRPESMVFSVGEAETLLASGCLNVLCSDRLHYDICKVTQSNGFPPTNLAIENLQQRLEKNTTAGLRYATVHGLSHIASCIEDRAVLMKLQEFFKSKLLYWIELMSLLGEVYRLRRSIHHLKSRIQDRMAHPTDILMEAKNWCDEIQNLIHPFQAVIERSAMQVYFSALPFAPPTSCTAGIYQQKFMNKIPNVRRGPSNAQSRSDVLAGHTGSVFCLSISPDGRWIASGCDDGTVRLWDVATGAATRQQPVGHAKGVNCLSFSPDSRKLASGFEDGVVHLWDVTTGAGIGESPAGHTEGVNCLSFSPNGQELASGSDDGTVRLWDSATGGAAAEPLSGHTDGVKCLTFSADGQKLASGSEGGTVHLWVVKTGAAVSESRAGHTEGVNCLFFSPDGRKLASGSSDGTVCFWNVATGAAIGKPLESNTPSIICLSFSPDGQKLALGSDDGTVRLWDITSGAAVGKPFAGHTSSVKCLSFSPDGRKLASGSRDHTVRLWNVTAGEPVGMLLAGHTNGINCLSFSPGGQQLVSGSDDSTVRLWDLATGAAVSEPLTGHSSEVKSLSFSPDGRKLASGSRDGTVRLWDVVTGTVADKQIAGHPSSVVRLLFSPDGRKFASGSRDGTVRLWDVTTGAVTGEQIANQSSPIEWLLFSPDSQILAFRLSRGRVHLWAVATGEAVFPHLAHHFSEVNYLSFSCDGQKLASVSHDHKVYLWNVAAGAAIGRPLAGYTSRVKCLSFSPDGQTLASGSSRGMVHLWNATTGAAIGGPLVGHWDQVSYLSFSLDGRRLASACHNQRVFVWDVTTGARIGEPLTLDSKNIKSLAFSPDGGLLAAAIDSLEVHLWDVATSAAIGCRMHDDSVQSVSFHIHNGSLLLVANGLSAIWHTPADTINIPHSADTLNMPHSVQSSLPSAPFLSRAPTYHPRGTYIYNSTNLRFTIPSSFKCGLFVPHGRRLAYGGEDGSVIIVDCSHLS